MLNKWDRRFLRLAQEISTWSKDPSKQIGAIYVKHRRILATGYNGFPRMIFDHKERYEDRETKYTFVTHAEMNGIYNASYNGISLKESTLFVYGLPVCHECAKGIIQVGVNRVVMVQDETPEQWNESFKITKKLFEEAGIEWEFVPLKDIL